MWRLVHWIYRLLTTSIYKEIQLHLRSHCAKTIATLWLLWFLAVPITYYSSTVYLRIYWLKRKHFANQELGSTVSKNLVSVHNSINWVTVAQENILFLPYLSVIALCFVFCLYLEGFFFFDATVFLCGSLCLRLLQHHHLKSQIFFMVVGFPRVSILETWMNSLKTMVQFWMASSAIFITSHR